MNSEQIQRTRDRLANYTPKQQFRVSGVISKAETEYLSGRYTKSFNLLNRAHTLMDFFDLDN